MRLGDVRHPAPEKNRVAGLDFWMVELYRGFPIKDPPSEEPRGRLTVGCVLGMKSTLAGQKQGW
jgi:hypothetical protein